MEQGDQQEAVASLTVAGKEKKKVSFMTGIHICLVNSAFSAGQRMRVVLIPHEEGPFLQKASSYVTALNHNQMLQFQLPLTVHLPG